MSTKRITLGEVRLCYVHLDEPWTPIAGSKGEKGKYCITALIPKSNTQLVQSITESLKEVYQEGVSGPWNGKTPPSGYWHNPLQDGDTPKQDGAARGHEFDGHFFITAKTLSQPEVYGPDRTLQGPDIIYPGCYGWLSIALKPYMVGGNMGISCFLNAVMKTNDGDNLASPGFDQSGRGNGGDFSDVPVPGPVMSQQSPFQQQQVPPQKPSATPDLSTLDRSDLEEMLKKLLASR